MDFDLTAALQSLRGVAVGFLRQLPYIAIALLAFALFYVGARFKRRVIRRLTERRRHRNDGVVQR